ncbi:hypothetical protein MMC29_001219 [Sticta canariensis]|nr:hypothetical protein [Sticta canariensis]
MAQGPIDPDQFTTPFQLTKGMHRDVYPTVDPKSGGLKVTGKVVVITGAGGGLGYAAAKAWSLAGAAGICLVGRTASTLESTAKSLHVPSLVATGDLVSESDAKSIIEQAVAKFGKVDALIHSAGSMNGGGPSGEVEPSRWFSDFEVNVKGSYNISHYFIKATGGKGTIINLVTLGASFLFPNMSSYASSKLALIKLGEFLDLDLFRARVLQLMGSENPELRVFSVHPGLVEAEEGRGSVVPQLTPFAKDKALLFGGVSLYLQKPEADFLRGGYISVNWDLEELEVHKGEIAEKKLIKLGFLNGQLAPGGYHWASAGEKKA